MQGHCESCGSEEDEGDLVAVHRVYLVTDAQGQVIGERVLDEVEHWCASCRALYPHRRPAG